MAEAAPAPQLEPVRGVEEMAHPGRAGNRAPAPNLPASGRGRRPGRPGAGRTLSGFPGGRPPSRCRAGAPPAMRALRLRPDRAAGTPVAATGSGHAARTRQAAPRSRTWRPTSGTRRRAGSDPAFLQRRAPAHPARPCRHPAVVECADAVADGGGGHPRRGRSPPAPCRPARSSGAGRGPRRIAGGRGAGGRARIRAPGTVGRESDDYILRTNRTRMQERAHSAVRVEWRSRDGGMGRVPGMGQKSFIVLAKKIN